jgi:hypothetical protein
MEDKFDNASAPDFEFMINEPQNNEDLPTNHLGSTMNIRLNKTIDFLTEENKYFRDKINKLDEILRQLKYQIISYKQMLLDKNIEKKDSVYCVLCMDNNRNVLFKPCNHIVICDTCSGATDLQECIICKASIDSYEYAYLV